MIRRVVGVSLFLALLAPLLAFDRAPLICVMGGVVTLGEVGQAVQHHMVHNSPDSRSRTHDKSHSCVCPWECGSSRAPADVVHPPPGLSVTTEPSSSRFELGKRPANADDAFLPLTTGPPLSLRG